MLTVSESSSYMKDGRTRRILPFFREYPILNATLLRALLGGASGLRIPQLLLNMADEQMLHAIAPPLGAPVATRYCLYNRRSTLETIITESHCHRSVDGVKDRILHCLVDYPILSERLLTLTLRTERIFYFEALNDLITSGVISVVEAPDLRTGRRLYLCRYTSILLPFLRQNKSL